MSKAEEVNQGHSTRLSLYDTIQSELEKQLGKPVVLVAYCTSFVWPVVISDSDADMLEEILQNTELDDKELVVLLNSPGGDGLAAERIVNICRSHCKGGFSVIVPKKAKSAATMICLGAKQVLMSETAELGPIDPQMPVVENGKVVDYRAAHEIIASYKELMTQATRTKGRIEPFLQQLNRFDARDIHRIISAQQLSESIAIKSLKSGAMRQFSEREIKRRIRVFLDPTQTKVHGRPIYHDVAAKCGLPIKIEPLKTKLWQAVWELYFRLNYVTTFSVSKIIETSAQLITQPIPDGPGV